MKRVVSMCVFAIIFLTGFTTAEEPFKQEEEEHVAEEMEADADKDISKEALEDEEAAEIESQFADQVLLQVIKDKLKSNGHEQLSYAALKEIKELTKLRELGIENLQGIELLTELVVLEMRDNKIKDVTPLAELKNLKEIDLRTNAIESLDGIELLTNLKELDVRENNLSSLEAVKDLKALEKLDVRDNKIDDLKPLENLSNLKELSARNNNISDLSPLENLLELEVVNLHTNQINDIGPLQKLTKIKELVLRRNQISDISVLQYFTLLEDLNIRDNKITDISPLADLQSLTVRLHLRDNPIDDFSPIAHYYDNIADTDFVITDGPVIDLGDINTLDGVERIAKLKQYIIDTNQHIKENSIKKEKFTQLAANPFAFYRGTASLFFLDVKDQVVEIPNEWQKLNQFKTWITGDLHVENLGFYGNQYGEAIFELNDFDEAAIAPFYFDLLNYGTSLYLLNDEAPNLQLDAEGINHMVQQYGSYYKDAIENVANGSVNVQDHYFTQDNLDGFIGEFAAEVSKEPLQSQLTSWTIVEEERLFDMTNNRLEEVTAEEEKEILSNWDSYLNNIDSKIIEKVGKGYFNIKDMARRVHAGLGSLGYDRYYILIEGKTDSLSDDIILDVKAQGPSAVEASGLFTGEAYPTHASRTIDGVFSLLNYADIHWGTLETENQSYLVKERSPYKDEVGPTNIKGIEDLDNYIKASAEVTAYAHSRAAGQMGNKDFASQLSATFHELENFEEEFAEVSLKYYAQVNKDHELYSDLYSEGAFTETDQEENTDQENDEEVKDENEEVETNPEDETNEDVDSDQQDENNSQTDERNEEKESDDKEDKLDKDRGEKVEKERIEESQTSQNEKENDEVKGEALPKTATSTFNFLLIGITLLLIGSIMFYLYKRKKLTN